MLSLCCIDYSDRCDVTVLESPETSLIGSNHESRVIQTSDDIGSSPMDKDSEGMIYMFTNLDIVYLCI